MPISQKTRKILLMFSIALLLIASDQLAKYIIRTSGGFYICNQGIAFGISLPHWSTLILVTALICFFSLLILNSKIKNFKFILNFPLILILSGAFSNLFDRISYGCVIDFIDLKIWPVFNLADIFICAGAFLLIFQSENLAKKS